MTPGSAITLTTNCTTGPMRISSNLEVRGILGPTSGNGSKAIPDKKPNSLNIQNKRALHKEIMYWPVTEEKSFKDISIFSSGDHFVQPR